MKFSSVNGYMGSRMWLTSMLIQYYTLKFCRQYWNKTNDPSGGMYDQMTRAARAVTANIAEGLGRHQTSRETEMRLLDVARASLSELYSDYYFLMFEQSFNIWPRKGEAAKKFDLLKVETPDYNNDWPNDSMAYLRQLIEKFEPWCNCQRVDVAINSIMALIERVQLMIAAKMNVLLDEFKNEGGFTESLTRQRLDYRAMKAAVEGAPKCPQCGKPMIKRMILKGSRQGEQFWGCSDYPRCNATLPMSIQ